MSLPNVALNMIVKNESNLIRDLLHCAAPFIQYWTIVDTGSTDSTPEIVQETFKELNIPGKLHRTTWKDFGTNRSEALAFAKGTAKYHWVMDADDWIHGTPNFSNLTASVYYLKIGKEFTYYRKQLFRDDHPWRYEGVLHEFPTCDKDVDEERLEGDYYIDSRRLGARNNDPKKYLKDAAILEGALSKDPDNARNWFYLGQSLYDAGEYEKAISAYNKRISLKGWEEEIYYSYFRIGLCHINLNHSSDLVLSSMLVGFQTRPTRAESLHELAFYFRQKNELELAAMFAHQASLISFPQDVLFIDVQVYSYKALDELSVSGFYSQNLKKEGYNACKVLSERVDIPEEVRNRSIKNLKLYKERFEWIA